MPCAPWIIEQVERARERAELGPLELACPTDDVVEATLATEPDDPVRLSGFAPNEVWVGAALVALVETRAASRQQRGGGRTPPRLPEAPQRPAEVKTTRIAIRPHAGAVATTLQLGAEVALHGDWFAVALGVDRHARSIDEGSLEAVDLVATVGTRRAVARVAGLDVTLMPMLGAGVTRLRGEAASMATLGAQAYRATARATIDPGLASAPSESSTAFEIGARVGLRAAPTGRVDGHDVLPGTAVMLSIFVGFGWRS